MRPRPKAFFFFSLCGLLLGGLPSFAAQNFCARQLQLNLEEKSSLLVMAPQGNLSVEPQMLREIAHRSRADGFQTSFGFDVLERLVRAPGARRMRFYERREISEGRVQILLYEGLVLRVQRESSFNAWITLVSKGETLRLPLGVTQSYFVRE